MADDKRVDRAKAKLTRLLKVSVRSSPLERVGESFIGSVHLFFGQDGTKIERRVESVQFGGSNETVERRSSLAAAIGSHE